jgi:3-deoxy-manno-octulosonate cytidylyltransferase (CMP-KDO synthetase)
MAALPRVGIIIPARYASSRYPGKPLAHIKGASGIARSLIERSWLAAKAVPDVAHIWIATDDERIADAAHSFGADVLMTSPECRNGTERCAEAIGLVTDPTDIIVNLQGDALLTPSEVVTSLVSHMRDDCEVMVATPAIRCTPSLYRHLIEDQAQDRVGGTTVVADSHGNALYFSKRVIPHLPPDYDLTGEIPVYLHMGVYAYRAEALGRYSAAPPSLLEQLEGLEQLRFLDAGIPVAAVNCETPRWDVIELNNPSDLAPIEDILKARGLE